MNADKKAVLRVKARGGCGWTIGILLGALVVLGFVASGCSKGTEVEAAPTVTVQVGAAENQTIERKVSAEGTLYPLEQSAIVPKISAPVRKFYVEKGSKVHAGQLLAELENSDLLASQKESEGTYAQAEASYEQAVQKAEQDRRLAEKTIDASMKIYNGQPLARLD